MMPVVSIVLPTCDRLHFLRATVASVFAQTFADFELIVADDGSADETRSWLEGQASDPRVRILWLTHSGSPARVRNAGIEAARGEFVAFLDSDDLWEPDKLRLQVELLRTHTACDWAYCAFTRIDEQGATLAGEATRRWLPCQGDIFAETLLGRASIRTPCVVARRAAVKACGGFDPQIACGEDYDLWLRLALRSPVALVDAPIVHVRISTDGYSGRWPHVVAWQIKSIEKLQGMAPARWQPLLQRQRARHSIALAREYAARGASGAMFDTLRRSLPFAWRYPETWPGTLKALLHL